jgi:hypothetical protein
MRARYRGLAERTALSMSRAGAVAGAALLLTSAGSASAAATVMSATSPSASAALLPRLRTCDHDVFGLRLVCLTVRHRGQFVAYATVINVREPPGGSYIINKGDGKIHHGPSLQATEMWSYHFNRYVKRGDQICGGISSLTPPPCVTIG